MPYKVQDSCLPQRPLLLDQLTDVMMRLATRALAAHGRRRAALTVGRSQAHTLRSFALFSTSAEPPSDKEEVALPSHIKFRMPDLDFKVRLSMSARLELNDCECKLDD